LIQYEPNGGATAKTHYCVQSFENAVGHAHGIFDACRKHRELQPDLIVGHSGFGSTLFLRELYDCPIVNYFEYFYRPRNSDMDFRPEFPSPEIDVLRSYCRNAMILLDLQYCDAGYSPTCWQKNLLPNQYADKVRVIFDGVDTDTWRRHENVPREISGRRIDADARIVTYVARGFEAMRGFDIFMKVAKRIYQQMPNVLFVVVGSDQIYYGGDLKHTGTKSFREWALKQEEYNLSKFLFTGMMQPLQLARLLSISDLHLYWTVPFVLSWSLIDALACGCTVLASNTEPVQEFIEHEKNGLLANFYDVDRFAELSLQVLRDPTAYRLLGQAGAASVRERYALDCTLPATVDFFQSVVKRT
jgi:glycosyltransferase involved in cell wall biosynthesis